LNAVSSQFSSFSSQPTSLQSALLILNFNITQLSPLSTTKHNIINMPYIAVILPSIPEDHKDQFLAKWPEVAEEIKKQPSVLGVSAGPVVAEDGAAATGFKFIQTIGIRFSIHVYVF
jgi:hypothetical protein